MTLSADILALAPVLYWPLDDASGSTAADASGHGHPGTLTGGYVRHQYGPEPATYATQLAAGGQVSCTGFPQLSGAPWSLVFYLSRNKIATPSNGNEFVFGNDAAHRGVFSNVGGPTTFWGGYIYNTANSLISSATWNIPVWDKWWHAYGLTHDGSTMMGCWMDGQNAVGGSNFTLKTILATDPFSWVAAWPSVLAHVVWYDKVLTAGQMTQLHSYRYDWPFGPMVNQTWPSPPAGGGALSPTDPVVVDINADLSDIHRAVIHDYTTGPPP